jgi:light-harvesting protein B-800-850 alpha chain
MNQAGIWLVVKPTVGLPLLLGSVAITSLLVHASILTHTTWFSSYWEGNHHRTAALSTTAPVAAVPTTPAMPALASR